MKVGLFIPCYIDQFYPQVGIATLELLEKYGCEVAYPLEQTCCGQPMANSGYEADTDKLKHLFRENFSPYDYVVCPSGSCTLHVKEHVAHGENVGDKTFELIEFLHDILKVEEVDAEFPHKVGLHASCHGLRGLRIAKSSELHIPAFNKTEALLKKVKGLQLVDADHRDECCGFGGTFAIGEEALSVKMGKDRIADHQKYKAEVITGNDMSCLMHMEGILKRDKGSIRILHVAEILNGKHL